MPKRLGFTLFEVLGVVVILGILGGIAYPQFAGIGKLSRPLTMAATVKQIREMIAYHAALGDVPASIGGYPLDLDRRWFPLEQWPRHTWTQQPLNIEIVDGDWDEVYPEAMHFDVDEPRALSAWYNATNGEFCVLVPDYGTSKEIEEMFHLVNGTNTGHEWVFSDDDGDDDSHDSDDDSDDSDDDSHDSDDD